MKTSNLAEPEPRLVIQLPRNEGIGTMAAYNAMRERQMKNAARNADFTGNAEFAGTAGGSGTAPGNAENDEPYSDNEDIEKGIYHPRICMFKFLVLSI